MNHAKSTIINEFAVSLGNVSYFLSYKCPTFSFLKCPIFSETHVRGLIIDATFLWTLKFSAFQNYFFMF